MQDTFLTIDDKITGEGRYTEKRSKFLAFAHHVDSTEHAMEIVDRYRKKYYDARHCCYAYVVGTDHASFRANDDGEPSSTAGKPILGQIHSRELTNVLVVVVRYYGGINLGTGGLIVAYRTAAAMALDQCKVVERVMEQVVDFQFSYPMLNGVMRLAKNMGARIVGQEFGNTCTIRLAVRKSLAGRLRDQLDNLAFQ